MGIDIVLNEGDYTVANDPNPFKLDLAFARKPDHVLDQAVGIRQLNLSLEQCRNLEIPLPPLGLQHQFADFVEQVDKSKQKVKAILKKTETLKKKLMQDYFG